MLQKKNKKKSKNREKLENSAHTFERTLFFYIKINKVTIYSENRNAHFKYLLKNWL